MDRKRKYLGMLKKVKKKKRRRERYQKIESFDNVKEYRLILLSAAFVFLILHSSHLYILFTKQS